MVRPRIHVVPPCVSSRGPAALEFARAHGIELYEWQQLVLRESLGLDTDGRWAASRVGQLVSRQSGKTRTNCARVLYGAFELGEEMIIYSAHEVRASKVAFNMLVTMIEGSSDLSRKVKAVRRANGDEAIILASGPQIRFQTRTKGAGRSFACDLLVLDEAHTIPESAMAALAPMMLTRIGQLWFSGSAVDRTIHEHGAVFALLREEALSGEAPDVAFFAWSPQLPVDEHGREVGLDELDDAFLFDELTLRAAQPSLGEGTLNLRSLDAARRQMTRRGYAVEILSIGDYPRSGAEDEGPISLERWLELVDTASEPLEPLALAVDISSTGRASLAVGGKRSDGRVHAGLVASDLQVEGATLDTPGGLYEAVREFVREHATADHVYIDERVLRTSVRELLMDASYCMVDALNTSRMADACDRLRVLVAEDRLRHVGSDTLTDALKRARARPLGDAFLWSRRLSQGDSSPVIAFTLAAAAAAELEPGTDTGIQIFVGPLRPEYSPVGMLAASGIDPREWSSVTSSGTDPNSRIEHYGNDAA